MRVKLCYVQALHCCWSLVTKRHTRQTLFLSFGDCRLLFLQTWCSSGLMFTLHLYIFCNSYYFNSSFYCLFFPVEILSDTSFPFGFTFSHIILNLPYPSWDGTQGLGKCFTLSYIPKCSLLNSFTFRFFYLAHGSESLACPRAMCHYQQLRRPFSLH